MKVHDIYALAWSADIMRYTVRKPQVNISACVFERAGRNDCISISDKLNIWVKKKKKHNIIRYVTVVKNSINKLKSNKLNFKHSAKAHLG